MLAGYLEWGCRDRVSWPDQSGFAQRFEAMMARAGAHPFGRKNLYAERASRVPWCLGLPLVLPRVLEEVAER